MKAEEIKKHLAEVHKEIVENCCGNFKELVEKHTYFAGGCIASLYHNEKPNDYDLYFTNEAAARYALWTWETHLQGNQIGSFTKSNFRMTSDYTGNAATFILGTRPERKLIQFIYKYYGKPEQVVSKFDFEHCTNYYQPQINALNLNDNICFKGKILIYKPGGPYPGAAFKRITKFAKRGWRDDPDVFEAVLRDLAKLNLKDKKVLKEQIKGMYSVGT